MPLCRALRRAVREATAGLIDADLGGWLIKLRVARAGQGKRGGHRTIIACRVQDRAVFLLGFPKSAKDDLNPDERTVLARFGASWLRASEPDIESAIIDGELTGGG